MTTTNITLTPAEAAQVVEKLIALAESEYGYGEQARTLIGRAIAEVRDEQPSATMTPGATSIPAPEQAQALSVEERLSRLERAARSAGLAV